MHRVMKQEVKTANEDVFEKLPVPAALRKMILPAVTSQAS